jgi:hypothetical protein
MRLVPIPPEVVPEDERLNIHHLYVGGFVFFLCGAGQKRR